MGLERMRGIGPVASKAAWQNARPEAIGWIRTGGARRVLSGRVVRRFAGAGHGSHVTHPEGCAAAVVAFAADPAP
jgi:pimeloyl-ACP methyl ester carboxylesterase